MLMLSGGLDSRFIYATLPERPPHSGCWDCVTFGERGCDDIRIARQVVRMKPTMHHCVYLSPKDGGNFMEARRQTVWWCDGMCSIADLWYNDTLRDVASHYSVNLNGFLGDAIVGGGYLKYEGGAMFEAVESRGRKMIAIGSRLWLSMGVEQRKPFIDNGWIDYLGALDHGRLAGSRLYNRMLLQALPACYTRIAWQKTGLPLGSSYGRKAVMRVLSACRGACARAGLGVASRRRMSNYHAWVNDPENREYIVDLLAGHAAELRGHCGRRELLAKIRHCLGHPQEAREILGMVTLEFWMRHLKERRRMAV